MESSLQGSYITCNLKPTLINYTLPRIHEKKDLDYYQAGFRFFGYWGVYRNSTYVLLTKRRPLILVCASGSNGEPCRSFVSCVREQSASFGCARPPRASRRWFLHSSLSTLHPNFLKFYYAEPFRTTHVKNDKK